MTRKALLILGMHRSGTSALARVCALRGAQLPRHLLPANSGNAQGYWEPESVVRLNDEILGHLGLAWDDAFAAQQLPDPAGYPPRFAQQARQILTDEYGDAALLVLKDPRCTLLAPFWRAVLGSMQIQVAAVVVARDYNDVVRSLVKRDGIAPETAALAYVAYGLDALRDSDGASFVTYHQLLDDWRGVTARIAAEQDLSWPLAADAAADEIETFLQPPSAGKTSVSLGAPVHDWVEAVWQQLQFRAGAVPEPAKNLAAVQSAMAQAGRWVAPLQRDKNRKLLALTQSAAQLDDKLAETASQRDKALGERDEALRVYGQTEELLRKARADHNVLEESYAGLKGERDEALRIYGQTESLLRKARADHSALEQSHVGLIVERDEALRIYAQTETLLRKAQSDHKALGAEHDSLQAEYTLVLSERDEAFDELDMRTDAWEEHKQHYEAALENMTMQRDQAMGAYRNTEDQLQQTQQHYRELDTRFEAEERAHQQVSGQLRTVLDSRSWRLTKPLRWTVRLAHRTLGAMRGLPTASPQAPAGPVGMASPPPTALANQDDASAQAPTPPSISLALSASAPTSGKSLQKMRRKHASLHGYLERAFDAQAADRIVQRIDRYGLPVETSAVRAASQVSCSLEQAQGWVAALAARSAAAPAAETPDVSIVIPVYNQLPFTLACLDALLENASRYSVEILIGDDASTDATPTVLEAAGIANVQHIRHAQNLGFVRNCNATAAHAHGRFVLFLNNDTQVLPGWLDELIGILEHDDGIGLAGSKLVYPDGRLQECGAIVWRDGSAWNYGRLADPAGPEVSYLRDTDYISGASIALRRDLWVALDGFDERYVPAYAEDADLAFRIRARGLRSVVQPLSQLLHFEGVSSGTDLGAGAKAYQVENLRKLHERWADAIAGHRDNADRPELEKERAVQRRVLFIDHCTPTPNEDAGSVVALEVMKAFMACGCKVTFIPEDNFAHMGADTHALQRIGIEPIYHPAYTNMEMFLARRKDPFDIVFMHRFGVGDAHLETLRKHFPDARVIFLNADMHHLREMREAELSGDDAAMTAARHTRGRELDVVDRADVTLVHSDFEQALLQRELPDARVVLFPLIHDPVESVTALDGRSGLVFVGGFRHPPNADGIIWFVDQVWPLVRARNPEAQLHVVGSHMTDDVKALAAKPGVQVEGFIEDLDAFLDLRRLSIAPLRYGAGAKGKVANSLARGLPVVCTPQAAEGMCLRPGEDVLVGDIPQAFADHVIALLDDDALWHRLSQAGVDHARSHTSRACARQRIRGIVDGGLVKDPGDD